MAVDPTAPRRDQLQQVFKSHDLVKKFEKLFKQGGETLPTDVTDLYRLFEEAVILAQTAEAKANQALALVSTLTDRSQKVVTVTSSYTAMVGNYSILADATGGNIVITLPLASTAKSYSIGVTKLDASANTVTLARSGPDLIIGETSQVLSYDAEVINVISDGSNWQLVS